MPQQKIRTILIDDEYFNRELVKMMILRIDEGFDIIAEAEGVREGQKLIEELDPDVIFLDIRMPDGSGFDMLRNLRTRNVHVVFITGFDDFQKRAKEYDAVDYVLKPIDQDKLRLTLSKIRERIAKGEKN